jgi:hypothetical protein
MTVIVAVLLGDVATVRPAGTFTTIWVGETLTMSVAAAVTVLVPVNWTCVVVVLVPKLVPLRVTGFPCVWVCGVNLSERGRGGRRNRWINREQVAARCVHRRSAINTHEYGARLANLKHGRDVDLDCRGSNVEEVPPGQRRDGRRSVEGNAVDTEEVGPVERDRCAWGSVRWRKLVVGRSEFRRWGRWVDQQRVRSDSQSHAVLYGNLPRPRRCADRNVDDQRSVRRSSPNNRPRRRAK